MLYAQLFSEIFLVGADIFILHKIGQERFLGRGIYIMGKQRPVAIGKLAHKGLIVPRVGQPAAPVLQGVFILLHLVRF
ncbi:hypothetical protein SJDPG12_09490 [Porphyromonas gingivalis SJD12]|nr:hypothetical protein SJDPG12_09490 [Porphyromonas gingivalis SJD12]